MPDEHSTNDPDSKISGLYLQPSPTALISFIKYDGADGFSFDEDHRPKNSLTARYYRDEEVQGVRLPESGSTKPIIPLMPDKPSNACFGMIQKDNKKAITLIFLSNQSEPRPLTSAWSGMSSRGERVRLVAAGFDGPTPTSIASTKPDWVVISDERSRASLGFQPSGE
jgi:hypothetical protein